MCIAGGSPATNRILFGLFSLCFLSQSDYIVLLLGVDQRSGLDGEKKVTNKLPSAVDAFVKVCCRDCFLIFREFFLEKFLFCVIPPFFYGYQRFDADF